jgi:DNA adenine methylase
MEVFLEYNIIKSPLNYIGGKHKLLPQIIPLFPNDISSFVDLFVGGCNVGINVKANSYIFNDNLLYLIEMYESFLNVPLDCILNHIDSRISKFDLSLINQDGYLNLRKLFNSRDRDPLDLFVLIAFSFNHQIRFNSKHEFNNPFGKNRSSYNAKMKSNLIDFILRLKNINPILKKGSFNCFDTESLDSNSFVYCDPPYLITTGTYNDGKRGFDGWGNNEENELLQFLDYINSKNIKFGLSNVLKHKGKSNDILVSWLATNPNLKVHYLNHNYSNSNYQTINRDINASIEVLITNYE